MEGDTDAPYQWPSRTVLEVGNPDVYVEVCMDWFAAKTEPWIGPMLLEPTSVKLFKGESTGPASSQ